MRDGLSRRSFIKLAATAGAAAAVPGCKPAARHLIPYVVPDDNVTPGMPQFFATSCTECPAGCGLIARVHEGRAILLEGNPADPIGAGAVCARGQAALQGVYNPDRLATPQLRQGDGSLRDFTWGDADKMFRDRLAAAAHIGKDRVAFLGAPQGPAFERVVRAWLSAFESSRAVFYEPLATEPARNAAQKLFGRRDLPTYRIDQAEVLVSFGADFLETFSSPVELARQYAEFRSPRERRGTPDIGRSFYVGPRLNMTAGKCDEWIAVAPGVEAQVAWSVLHVMIAQRWVSQNSGVDLVALTAMVSAFDPASVSKYTGVRAETIARLGEAFGKADGALAIAPQNDESATLAAYMLNAVTGNVGRTMVFLDGAQPEPTTPAAQLDATIAAMRDGTVDVAVIAGCNPVYSMPASLRIAAILQRVPFVVWCGTVPDETAAMASVLLPAHHPLESWRDTMPRAGIYGLGQPIMQPVVASRATGDILLATIPPAPDATASNPNIPWKSMADAVKASWTELATRTGASDAEEFWTTVRQNGGHFPPAKTAQVKLEPSALQSAVEVPGEPPELAMFAYPHVFLYDGRGADKPWLQEIPEPVTQFVWDSWAEIHPRTARQLGVSTDQIIELNTEHGVIEAPAFVSERVRPGVIAIPLGQGHTSYGRYARNRGANPWAILPAGSRSVAVKTITPVGETRKLISPLFHRDETPAGAGEMLGRDIVLAMSVGELASRRTPDEEPLAPEPYEMYPPFPYANHKWGMTIDVNACTGCSACVAACYGENNVPVVGRDLVADGRIMSWLRLERYFPDPEKAADAPLIYLSPMLCQQCNHAPCEPVCPVFASYHTQEGLNGQVYNRCVGTRYCENNCPYKVRRFNWFVPEFPEPLNLQLNPDVTVRGAGVMEKCTFCVQRIQHAEITARIEQRAVRDGEIVTACQAACPTRAITFGDMNDADSAMMRRRRDNPLRRYRALEDLNTEPAVVYLRGLYREKGKA